MRASRARRASSTGSGGLRSRSPRAVGSSAPADGELVRAAHRTIDRVSDDILRRFQFHTPIAALFELVNEIYRVKDDPSRAGEVRFATETVLSLMQPYAPHVAEELWERLGGRRLWETAWPVADPALVASDVVEIVVQVNGKLRDRLQVPAGTPRTSSSRSRSARSAFSAYLGEGSPRTDDRRAGPARERRRVVAGVRGLTPARPPGRTQCWHRDGTVSSQVERDA